MIAVGLHHDTVVSVENLSTGFFGVGSSPKIAMLLRNGRNLRLSFHAGKRDEFCRLYKQLLFERTTKPQAQFDTSNAGISGLIKQMNKKTEDTDKALSEAFTDLSALMDKAKDMVVLSDKLRTAIEKQKKDNESSNEEEEFRSFLVQMGIAAPVTKATVTTYKTEVIYKTLDPKWKDEEFVFDILEPSSIRLPIVYIEMWDEDRVTKDDRMGQVRINIEEYRTRGIKDLWLPLEGKPGKKAASRCIVSEEFTKSLQFILVTHGDLIGAMKDVITQEIETTSESNVLFRTDSLATKLTVSFFKLMGQNYLKNTLTCHIESIMSKNTSFEVDPAKGVSDADIESNYKTFLHCCQLIIDAIFINSSFPPELRSICHHIYTQVAKRFPDESTTAVKAVGGFVFLRFINPTLFSPETLITSTAPSIVARRSLTLVTKLLQNISNQMIFTSKEQYLEKSNAFISSKIEEFIIFKHFKLYSCGLYGQPTCIGYDSVQRLTAIGFNDGTVKIFGINGIESTFRCDANVGVLKLILLCNTPFIAVVTSSSIEKWDYTQLKPVNSLNFKKRITSIGFMFGCYFQNEDSLIMIKGDNYKEIAHLGVSQVAHGIIGFVPVLASPYPGVKDLSSILTLTQSKEVVHYKLDSSMLPLPVADINAKCFTSDAVIMECFECPISVKEILLSSYQDTSSPITGGSTKDKRLFQLVISLFWDLTDPRSYLSLGKIDGMPANPTTLTFCTATLTLAISYATGVSIYSLNDGSRRVQKSTFPTPSPTFEHTNSPVQQLETTLPSPPQEAIDPLATATESSSPKVEDVPQTAVQQPPMYSLPDPVASGCQLIAEISLQSPVNAIAMNPVRSNTTRIIFGCANGSVVHFLITLTNNSGSPGVSSSRTIYTASIEHQGSTPPFDHEGKTYGITSLAICFRPLIQALYYTDKRGVPLNYVFIELPVEMTRAPEETAAPTEIITPTAIAMAQDDVNLVVCSSRDVYTFNVPANQVSQYSGIPGTSIHLGQGRVDVSSAGVVKWCIISDISSACQYLASLDNSGNIRVHGLVNLQRVFQSSTKVNSLIGCISNQGGVIFQESANSSVFCLCLQPVPLRGHIKLFIEGINLPEEPKVQAGIMKFFFGRATPNLEETYDIVNTFNQTRDALNERGEKINELANKSEEMSNASANFATMAAQLKNQNKSWF
eukprot:gene8981-10535_t